jgi:exosortase A
MTSLPAAWRMPLLVLAAAWLALGWAYFPTLVGMVEIWNRSETFAHAWVVPPISAWLVWRRRTELAWLVPRPSLPWLLALLPLGLLWLVGDLAVANAATQFAFLGMAVVMVPALLGRHVAGRIAFPLGFLFFAVPFGDFMTPWLMERTADFTVVALRATGIPVFREGLQFVIPSGSWSVVQACSGIRYMMASVMVGTLFAYLNFQSMRKRWTFVGVAIVTPLVANWLRAYMIVMLGHLSGNRLAVGVDHIIYGWVFFGVIMLAMFMMGSRWADPDAVWPSAAPTPPATGASRRVTLCLLGAAVLMAAPLLLRSEVERGSRKDLPALAVPQLPGWTWDPVPLADWHPAYANARGELHGQWRAEGRAAVGLYVGYYRDQRAGRQLVTSVNRLVDDESDKVWSVTGSSQAHSAGLVWRAADLRGQALSQVVGGGTEAPRLRAWQTYWINGRSFVSDWQAKLYLAWMGLLGQGDDAAVVIIYCDKAVTGPDDRVLREFADAYWPTLDTDLRGVRSAGRAAQR